MEGRIAGKQKSPAAASPALPRRCRDYPSFSSTLLDAIYRSIDETDGSPDPISARKKIAGGGVSERKKHLPPANFPGLNRRRRCTSSSSDGSSYGGFSSSDPESISAVPPIILRPIRTTPARFRPEYDPDPPIPIRIEENRLKNDRRGSIRSRLRDLTNGRTPSSPGARLANFLNSMFAAKSKVSAVSSPAANKSSHSQSCLKRSPAASGKRTVKFSPVSLVVADRRDAEEEDDGSDSSSDLFELKNLAAVGKFRDELPVYGGCISRGMTKSSVQGLEKKEKYKERC